jgi:hypothetical protein
MPWSKVLAHQPARLVARDIPVLHAMMTLLGHPMVVELGVNPGITLMFGIQNIESLVPALSPHRHAQFFSFLSLYDTQFGTHEDMINNYC